MKGTPVFRGTILTSSLTVVVALLAAACFNIILEEPPDPVEEPSALIEAMTVMPVLGDLHALSEPQSSNQQITNLEALEHDSAPEISYPNVTPGPTVILAPEPLPTYRLSVNGVPVLGSTLTLEGGMVEVSSPPREPEGFYWGGDRVYLTAIPEEGYQFDVWEGDCSNDGNVCIITIDGNRDLTAGFVPSDEVFVLDLVAVPEGSGEVQVRPSPNAPDGKYVAGTHLKLKAIDLEGFGFTGWDGACVGEDRECRIVMNGDRSVSASFEPDFYTLTINRVLVDGAGVSVGHGKIEVFPFVYAPNKGFARSAIVSLIVDPDAGYVVVDWGGDCSGLVPDATVCTLRMDGDKLVEVTFAEVTFAEEAADSNS